jgi:hypothetical protein
LGFDRAEIERALNVEVAALTPLLENIQRSAQEDERKIHRLQAANDELMAACRAELTFYDWHMNAIPSEVLDELPDRRAALHTQLRTVIERYQSIKGDEAMELSDIINELKAIADDNRHPRRDVAREMLEAYNLAMSERINGAGLYEEDD